MTIDPRTETVFTLSEAPKRSEALLGRRVSVSTFYRWATTGLKGIRLETRYLGGTQYTSEEALNRFFDAITQRCQSVLDASVSPFRRNSEPVGGQALNAWERELEADGL